MADIIITPESGTIVFYDSENGSEVGRMHGNSQDGLSIVPAAGKRVNIQQFKPISFDSTEFSIINNVSSSNYILLEHNNNIVKAAIEDAALQGPQGNVGAQGPQGPQGNVGAQGPQGNVGPQGPQGLRGFTGPQGNVGAQGPQGNVGAQGPQGLRGFTGPQGNVGAQGPQGNVGAQGPQGPQGNVGAQGPQGLRGFTGPQGNVGAQGPQGNVGAQGPQGNVGAQGPQGLRGFTGPQGNVGAQGPQGNVGAQGPQGNVGAQGPQGLRGFTGPQGNVGAQGPQGNVGAQGPQGNVGAQGPQGNVGAQGPQGPQGNVGAQGPQGNVGPQGPQGIQGLTGPQGNVGAQGPQGLRGFTGPQGNVGAQGPQGPQGLRGFTGPQGNVGAQGPQGNVGPQGPQGNVGPQGPQGIQGFTGPQGNVGAQGPQGPQGNTGPVGPVAGSANQVVYKDSSNSPFGDNNFTFDGDTLYIANKVGINAPIPNATLHVYSENSEIMAFNVEGTNGSLFSVVDNFSGALMSVNTVAGLPALEVNSDYSVVIGRFNQNDFVLNTSGNLGIGTSAPTEKIHIAGDARIEGALYDSSNSPGTTTKVLLSTGTGTAWTEIATAALQGQAGATGPQGPQGNVGAQGPQGNVGAQGPQGNVGAQGPQGLRGFTGPQGNVGAQGPQGSQGLRGFTGPQGSVGAQGPQGNVGPQGPSGLNGATGPQGPAGATGPSGGASIAGSADQVVYKDSNNEATGTSNFTFDGDKLQVSTSTANTTVFNLEGTNGSLFSVVDNLSGVLMSVNNNAGLPVFEVYDDDTVMVGRFSQNDFVLDTNGNLGLGTDSPTEKLHVVGSLRITEGIYDSLNSVGSSGNVLISTGSGIQWGESSGGFSAGGNSVAISGYYAVGSGTDNNFFLGSNIISANYTVPSGYNAMTPGPVTIQSGVVVTVSDGSTWTVV